MRMTFLSLQQITFIFVISMSPYAFSVTPHLSISAQFLPPSHLKAGLSTAAIYQVKNNSKIFTEFKLKPIPGVKQITTGAKACSDPIVLKHLEQCTLNLNISNHQGLSRISGGPVICKNNSVARCSQPPSSDLLNVTFDLASTASNSWISVLIADAAPPAVSGYSEYVSKIMALAPNAIQIHLRFPAGAINYKDYQQLINLLRVAYNNPDLKIGFHPDNSKSSYQTSTSPPGSAYWPGCFEPNWPCVLSLSVTAMNKINALAGPGQGFDIFSLEQSYVEPADPTTIQQIKYCLSSPKGVAPCPADPLVYASPVVTFGWVLPSYGGCTSDPCEYGENALDFGYPQYYNKVINLSGEYSTLVTNGYFPSYSAQACINGQPFPYTVVDAVTSLPAPPFTTPLIPCTSSTNNPNVYSYTDPSTGKISPTLAAAYVSYIMTQLPPIQGTTNINGATVFITFSGEGSYPYLFLGTPGWSLDLISQFNTLLNQNFITLKNEFPDLFLHGIPDMQYAIWSFDAILNNQD